MRLATWNVEYGCGLEKNRLRHELLLAADADVWVLTETHDELVLTEAHRPVHTTPRPRHPAGRWVTIWTRLPILEVVATSDPSRTAAALLEAPSGRLLVYGTVMPWHTDGGPDGTAKSWAEHHRVVPEQGAEWLRLLAAYPGARLCVAGDLNTTLGARGYGTRVGRELLAGALDAADLACLTHGETPHADHPRPFIDHVCVSRSAAEGARVVAAWEGTREGTRLSDHGAVVVEVPALSVPGGGASTAVRVPASVTPTRDAAAPRAKTPRAAKPVPPALRYRTVGERLRWSYACLAMACAAVEKGAAKYQPVHFMIRARLHRGLNDGSMSVGSLLHDERLKMNLPRACAYCGDVGRLSLDHLVPRVRGGGDEADNVVWACSPCNSSKGGLDLLAWLANRETFPPLYLLRRYLKLAFAWAEGAGAMDREVAELGEAPFAIGHVPLSYPPPTGLVLWVAPLVR